MRLRRESAAVIEHVAAVTGESQQGIVDLLLRSLSSSEVIALVRARAASDADAEAAWLRGRG